MLDSLKKFDSKSESVKNTEKQIKFQNFTFFIKMILIFSFYIIIIIIIIIVIITRDHRTNIHITSHIDDNFKPSFVNSKTLSRPHEKEIYLCWSKFSKSVYSEKRHKNFEKNSSTKVFDNSKHNIVIHF